MRNEWKKLVMVAGVVVCGVVGVMLGGEKGELSNDINVRGVDGELVGVGGASSGASGVPGSSGGTIDFNRDVRPILSAKCFICHGPDEAERKGGLRLDKRSGAVAVRDGIAAVVAGYPGKSELIARVTTDDDEDVMPPRKLGKGLTKEEIGVLKQWIKEGAVYAKHWSYVKPVKGKVPVVKRKGWVRNGIDRFVLARLEAMGWSVSGEADKRTLIRRVSLDLTGLPPAPGEVDAFLADTKAGAYGRLVDRLLARKRFGEHWARMWLDLARYADSAGYADDPGRTIWGYRDYVIRSFNANKRFDDFTVEQIAGDMLKDATEEQIIATAFHRNTQTNNEGGTNDEEFRNVAVVDRVNTTMAVWMGTTMACAQCHTHKYDPISQKEYFEFFAILNNTEDRDRRDEAPVLRVFSGEMRDRREKALAEIEGLRRKLAEVTPGLMKAEEKWDGGFVRRVSYEKAGAATGLKNGVVKLEVGKVGSRLEAVELALSGKGKVEIGTLRGWFEAKDGVDKGRRGRYLRIELTGRNRILSLAEVQVFSRSGVNAAKGGVAKQSSTDFGGPAGRAIDGNTNGDYQRNSVTHTAISTNPWWEVDMRGVKSVDRIVVWNRTGGDIGSRLDGYRVVLLDDKRREVWSKVVKKAARVSGTLSTSGRVGLKFGKVLLKRGGKVVGVKNALKGDGRGGLKGVVNVDGGGVVVTAVLDKVIAPRAGSVMVLEMGGVKLTGQVNVKVGVSGDGSVGVWRGLGQDVFEALMTKREMRDGVKAGLVSKYWRENVSKELKVYRDGIVKLEGEIKKMKATTVPVMRERKGKARVTQIQRRGNFLDKGDVVQPGLPSAFPALAKGLKMDRLGMARWLVDKENPLTARVMVNRLWEQFFGMGLVATSEEFGSQGELPSHPELLDWLAVEFMESGWDMKKMMKLMVTSATYRQRSGVSSLAWKRDPQNRMLGRGPRLRLTAEEIRDQALAVSGLLSGKMYGAPVRPPKPKVGLSAAFGGGIDWAPSGGEDRYRRGLYTQWRRSNPYPSMMAFDASSREFCVLKRSSTNTPLQAFVTLNDPVFVEAAQALARRVLKEGGADDAGRVRYMFKLCLSREGSAREMGRVLKLIADAKQIYTTKRKEAEAFATVPIGKAPAGMDVVELAGWTLAANVMLNLDEFLMPR